MRIARCEQKLSQDNIYIHITKGQLLDLNSGISKDKLNKKLRNNFFCSGKNIINTIEVVAFTTFYSPLLLCRVFRGNMDIFSRCLRVFPNSRRQQEYMSIFTRKPEFPTYFFLLFQFCVIQNTFC